MELPTSFTSFAKSCFDSLHNTLLAHAAAQEVLHHVPQSELGIMLRAEWLEGVEGVEGAAGQAARSVNREAAERILQCQIGCILSPVFHGHYPAGLGLPSFSAEEQSQLARTSFLMILHSHAGQVQVEQKAQVLHMPATPATLSRMMRWLSCHGYCPAAANDMGGLHIITTCGSSHRQQQPAVLQVLGKAIHHGVPVRGYWAAEAEAYDIAQAYRGSWVSDYSESAKLFSHPLEALGSLEWMDPSSFFVTLEFLELCLCLGTWPAWPPDLSALAKSRLTFGLEPATDPAARWDAWSALLDQVIAKSCWRHRNARQEATSLSLSSSMSTSAPSVSEIAVDLYIRIKRLSQEQPRKPPASMKLSPAVRTAVPPRHSLVLHLFAAVFAFFTY